MLCMPIPAVEIPGVGRQLTGRQKRIEVDVARSLETLPRLVLG
jgi:hypothetical protein